MEPFNRNFKTIREGLNLSTSAIADAIEGLTVDMVRNIELGRTKKFKDLGLYKKLEDLCGFTREELHNSEISAGAVRNRANRNKPGYVNEEIKIDINDPNVIGMFLKVSAHFQALLPYVLPGAAAFLNMDVKVLEDKICEERDQLLKSLIE